MSKVIEQYREYFFYDEKEGEFINRVDFTGKKNYPESWRRINQEFSALDILKDLLENGADPNLPEIFFKENPLVYTLKSSVPVAVDLLLKYGAKVSGKELVFIVSNARCKYYFHDLIN